MNLSIQLSFSIFTREMKIIMLRALVAVNNSGSRLVFRLHMAMQSKWSVILLTFQEI